MIVETATSPLISTGAASTRGFSETAHFVAERTEEGRRCLQSSHSLGMAGKGVHAELFRVASECRAANWDGYGAAPVEDETYRRACRFLDALPLGTPAPTAGAETDGHLTMEWYRDPSRVLSVSISPEGMIYYAAILGNSKRSGADPFVGEAPVDVLQIIGRIFSL